MCCRTTVSNEIADTSDEGAKCKVNISYDVKWETIPREHNREEREIGE